MMAFKVLRIKMSEWGRTGQRSHKKGGKSGHLLRNGLRCCMGFYCMDVGISDRKMLDWSLPTSVGVDDLNKIIIPEKGRCQFGGCSLTLQDALACVNDRDNGWQRAAKAKPAEQRALITKLFQYAKRRVVFE